MRVAFEDVRDVRAFCEDVRSIARSGNVDVALRTVAQFVIEVISRESSWATVFSSVELDKLCQDLGRLPPGLSGSASDPEQSVFIVTAIAGVGGHTRVLLDLVHADPAPNATILVSNVMHNLTERAVRDTLNKLDPSVKVRVAPSGDLSVTMRWLQDELRKLRPSRTYVLTHHFDSAIVAAVQPELVGRLFYYHNCDHSLALGVHLAHATHVDFNGKGYHHCRAVEGVKNGVYWPLVADVPVCRANSDFRSSGNLITATSGGLPKFDTSYLLEQVPYLYTYFSVLPTIMKASGGAHHHIGPLNEDMLSLIRTRLQSSGIPQEAFVHTPWVESVPEELIRRKVDLYIGSFPLGGGRASIEVMGAGIPLLLHANYASQFFTDLGEVYPGALSWEHPEQLEPILRSLTQERLADHASRGRVFYERNFTLEHLKNAVLATIAGASPSPPPPPEYYTDTLQRYLDLRALSTAGSSGVVRPAAQVRAVSTIDLAKVLIGRLGYIARRSIVRR